MEFVATIDQASDFIIGVAVILDLRRCAFEDGVAVLGHTQAHVVLKVGQKLSLLHVLVLKEVGLLLQHAAHHCLRVGLSVEQACFLHSLSVLVCAEFLEELSVGSTSDLLGLVCEWLCEGGSFCCTLKTSLLNCISHFDYF